VKLKEYQEGVLRKLDKYLEVLGERRAEAEAFIAFQKSNGKQATLTDYPSDAWKQLNNERRLPMAREKGVEMPVGYITRPDGLGHSVPNICLKVPTGGGKTLLAAASVGRIQADYFKRQTGLILWVVPSDAIFRQTWKQLADREHPYRQMLERASGGRVKLLEKSDAFTLRDVDGMLCILLLMLPSAARQSKDTLRMFRDSGKFTAFFPPEDDSLANERLLHQVRNLDCNDLAEVGYGQGILPGSVSLKQSLGNVLRLMRPVIILDEGHRAYSDTARSTLLDLNPRFILELSATPNTNGKHQSNVLVSVPGADLKDEQMIKLPINVINEAKGGWKHTLALAHAKLAELAREADVLRAAEGRYIRPILLVRVERTGKGQEEKQAVHAEHARQYLMETLGVGEEEIRLKTSDKNELGDEDLLAETCLVRYIITKDALREGWDCPFAYVLALLSNTTAHTALTQMIGRVLRQPHARLTARAALDECYVFTFDQNVTDAVDGVRRGLEDEGMADLASSVRAVDAATGAYRNTRRVTIGRRPAFARLDPILLPRLLHKVEARDNPSAWRQLNYEQDILGHLAWANFDCRHPEAGIPIEGHRRLTTARVDIDRKSGNNVETVSALTHENVESLPEEGLEHSFLVRHLLDVIPNPWQAMHVLEDSLHTLRENGYSEERLYVNRFDVVKTIRNEVRMQADTAAETLFREVSDEDRLLTRKSGAPLEKALFENVYIRDFNTLERNVAWYLDESKAADWWHRIAVGRDSYGLQGWQRNKVYPDFLARVRNPKTGEPGYVVLETKGDHLKGNDDSVYKAKLLDLLTQATHSPNADGALPLKMQSPRIRFRIVEEENWLATLRAEGL
jgi:type III restriction enzyme